MTAPRIRNLIFSVCIAGALGFGVTTASASPANGEARQSCTLYTSSGSLCKARCESLGYSQWVWNPANGCWECL
jgi:hypothetical protein